MGTLDMVRDSRVLVAKAEAVGSGRLAQFVHRLNPANPDGTKTVGAMVKESHEIKRCAECIGSGGPPAVCPFNWHCPYRV